MISYRINRQERLLTLLFAGTISVADWKAAISQAIAECPEVITFDSVIDGRSPHPFLTREQMDEFVRDVKKMGMQEHRRRSVYIAGNKAHFGISRMFELLTEPERKVERFTTESVAEAAAWLCRPEALVRAELDAINA